MPRGDARVGPAALEVHDMVVGGEVRHAGGLTLNVEGGDVGQGTRLPRRVPLRSVNDRDRAGRERKLPERRDGRESRGREVKGQLIPGDGRMEVKVTPIWIRGQFDDLPRLRPRAEVSKRAVVGLIVGEDQTGAEDSAHRGQAPRGARGFQDLAAGKDRLFHDAGLLRGTQRVRSGHPRAGPTARHREKYQGRYREWYLFLPPCILGEWPDRLAL